MGSRSQDLQLYVYLASLNTTISIGGVAIWSGLRQLPTSCHCPCLNPTANGSEDEASYTDVCGIERSDIGVRDIDPLSAEAADSGAPPMPRRYAAGSV